MSNEKLAKLLFPDVVMTPDDVEKMFPERNLEKGAIVTRIAPSPTGFIHLGNLYNAVIGERLSHQSNGVFFLRIEDTDAKREVEGAVDLVISSMNYYGIHFDEGATKDGGFGNYGPYYQRQRKDIYHVFAKKLVEMGLAYPCFCSEEKLDKVREEQLALKITTGYFGKYATCRNLSYEEVEAHIKAGDPYVLRFRADSETTKTITVNDAIRGEITIPENMMDFVILKSDGIPTYHFAHVIDDHFMRTTHVIRGEEWISSLPIHVQLFDTFGWKQPVYCHTATLMKMDGTSKRKLSKRKDPELGLSFYNQEGYMPLALWNYMLTILNSNYEEWVQKNSPEDYLSFPFSIAKMNNSGALFDLDKLCDISKEIISKMKAEDIYEKWLAWAKEYNTEWAETLETKKELAINALNIGRNQAKVRKDLVTWKQTCEFMSMYFDEYFKLEDEIPAVVSAEDRKTFFTRYLETLDFSDDKNMWFDKVKQLTDEIGYASNMKEYKKNPEGYKGSIVDVTNMLRVAVTGRVNAPDIWEVSMVLGEDCVRNRIKAVL